MTDDGGRGWAWAAIGCAAFLLLGFCVATGVGAYLVLLAPSHEPQASTNPPPVGSSGFPDKPGGGGGTGSVRVTAEVVSVTGTAPVSVGDTCSFEVDERPRPAGGSWCHTEISCGGRALYGGAQSGFFACAFDGSTVRGRDDHTTRDDGDGSLLLDTEARTLTLADDAGGSLGAFGLEARITRTD